MGFTNSVVGGQGALVRPAIKSPNFVHGVSGWSIDKDGNAEFTGLTLTGTFTGTDYVINSSGVFFYSGTPATGNLIVSMANASGSDSFGNAYPQGFGVAAGAIPGGLINAGTIGTTQLTALAVNASKIAANTITTSQIATAAGILGTQIAAATIAGSNLIANTVTASKIAANTITAAQIAAATITTGQIAAGTITGSNIAAGTITAINILANTITAAQLAAGIVYAGIVDATTINGANLILHSSTGTILCYSGVPASGNLIMSVSPVSGTDSHGNAYLAGVVSYASGISSQLVTGNVQFSSAAAGTKITGPGGASVIDTTLAAGQPAVEFFGPSTGGTGTSGSPALTLWGYSSDSSKAAFAELACALALDSIATVPPADANGVMLYAGSDGQPAYVNPSGTNLRLSGASLAAVNKNTVTSGTAFASLTVFGINANDAVAGAVYRITLAGYGTWGSTQQTLNLSARFGASPGAATDIVGIAPAVLNTALSASATFQWKAVIEAVCVTTGALGTWRISIAGSLQQTANALLPGTAADNTIPFSAGTGPNDITQDTTAAIAFGLSAKWASSTGAPTITKSTAYLERVA